MVNKLILICIVVIFSVALSGCVTQQFENGEKPVVQNKVNRDEMAATRISLGIGYLNMGNMPQAKQNLEKAKNFSPKMVQVYTAFAHYYETVGENSLAIDAFEKALSLKSDDADTLNNYGIFLCRQGDLDSAEKQILKAIAVPSYILVSKSYQNLASCFLQNDKFDKAEMYLNKAILHAPNSGETLFKMVRLQYAKADYQQAKYFKQRFEKVTRRFTVESLALACKVHLKLGQRRIAKKYGIMLVKMYPQSWEAQHYLLNELEVIEADHLAKRYQLTQKPIDNQKLKKRVIKLSPTVKRNRVTTIKTAPVLVKTTDSSVSSVEINEGLSLDNSAKQINLVNTGKINKPTLDKKPTFILSSSTSVHKKEIVSRDDTNEELEEAILAGAIVSKQKQIIKASLVENVGDKDVFHTPKKPMIIIEDTTVIDDKTELKSQQNKKIEKPASPQIYTVLQGDTLFAISLKYNIKMKALRRWNGLSSKGRIRPDDKIYLSDPAGHHN